MRRKEDGAEQSPGENHPFIDQYTPQILDIFKRVRGADISVISNEDHDLISVLPRSIDARQRAQRIYEQSIPEEQRVFVRLDLRPIDPNSSHLSTEDSTNFHLQGKKSSPITIKTVISKPGKPGPFMR